MSGLRSLYLKRLLLDCRHGIQRHASVILRARGETREFIDSAERARRIGSAAAAGADSSAFGLRMTRSRRGRCGTGIEPLSPGTCLLDDRGPCGSALPIVVAGVAGDADRANDHLAVLAFNDNGHAALDGNGSW